MLKILSLRGILMDNYVTKAELVDNTLVLFVEGEINSNNSLEVEKELFEAAKKEKAKKIVMDFSGVKYVSSAGLRTVLKMKQTFGDVAVGEATPEVYDILQMTGFTNIMEIRRALKTIDITNCELIGEGYCAVVYRIDKDTIVKVFKRPTPIEEVERELKLAKEAFVLGIPTAISFDVVRVGERLGVRFELLDSISLRDLFRDKKEDYEVWVKKYAALLKKINTTETLDESLPKTKDTWIAKLEPIKKDLSAKDYKKLISMMEALPERNTFVHGDCHIKNIMSQGGELLLIDMDTLSRGNPIFELAAIYCTYVGFQLDDPGNSEKFLGLSDEFSEKLFYDVAAEYLGNRDEATLDKIRIVAYSHFLRWNRSNEPENTDRFDKMRERLLELLPKYNDLNIEA